jgi:hypothetical protein
MKLNEMLQRVENRAEKQLVKRAALSDEFIDIRMSRQTGEVVISALVLEDGFYVLTQTQNYDVVEKVPDGVNRDYIKDELEELLDKRVETYTVEEARSE